MVLAAFTAALANGADRHSAAALANVAAGLEIERSGTVPISSKEILVRLLHEQRHPGGKERKLDELLVELAAHRQLGRQIVFTNGCFDILHAGHVAYLRQAREKGDLLVLGLNSDASVARLKGSGRPVIPQADRVLILGELNCVDYVVVFDDETPQQLIEAIRPDVLVKGADYEESTVVGADFVGAYGGRVELVELVDGRSSSEIILRIRADS